MKLVSSSFSWAGVESDWLLGSNLMEKEKKGRKKAWKASFHPCLLLQRKLSAHIPSSLQYTITEQVLKFFLHFL